jgi:hypothetical protein
VAGQLIKQHGFAYIRAANNGNQWLSHEHHFLIFKDYVILCHKEWSKSTVLLRIHGKRGRLGPTFLCAFAFPALVSLGSQNLTAIVVAASLASSMGHDGLTALGANRHAGSSQLPVGATALIAAGLGHFTLRNSHG